MITRKNTYKYMNTQHDNVMRYENALNYLKTYDENNDLDTNRLSKEAYQYSIKIYQSKIFENITRKGLSITIHNVSSIFQTLYNIGILSINYLGCLKRVDKEELMNENFELFRKKNRDYGDSFEDYELIGILVRINDKVNRMLTLLESRREASVMDEKIEDTINDLYNYCIIGLMYKPKDGVI